MMYWLPDRDDVLRVTWNMALRTKNKFEELALRPRSDCRRMHRATCAALRQQQHHHTLTHVTHIDWIIEVCVEGISTRGCRAARVIAAAQGGGRRGVWWSGARHSHIRSTSHDSLDTIVGLEKDHVQDLVDAIGLHVRFERAVAVTSGGGGPNKIQQLIELGADTSLRNKDGETAALDTSEKVVKNAYCTRRNYQDEYGGLGVPGEEGYVSTTAKEAIIEVLKTAGIPWPMTHWY
eukprot:COSAG01_NODE_1717_length_9398_cov_83.738574_5_plen_235_part_00